MPAASVPLEKRRVIGTSNIRIVWFYRRDFMNITVRTRDGSIYTAPGDVHVERNKETELFYRMVENYPVTEEGNNSRAST